MFDDFNKDFFPTDVCRGINNKIDVFHGYETVKQSDYDYVICKAESAHEVGEYF